MNKEAKEIKENINLSNYMREYERNSDDKEIWMKDIHEMAVTGKSISSAMGTKLPIVSWNDILILGAQLNPMPLLDDEKVNIQTIIGKKAKKTNGNRKSCICYTYVFWSFIKRG